MFAALENSIVARIADKVTPVHGLREVYREIDLPSSEADTVLTPAVVVAAGGIQVPDRAPELGHGILLMEWYVTAVARAYSERGRAETAADEAGAIALSVLHHLTGYTPDGAAGPLMFRSSPGRVYFKGKVFVPLLFFASIAVDAAEEYDNG